MVELKEKHRTFFLRDMFLLLALIGLTIITSEFKVVFVYGITYVFSSIFMFLVLRIYGLPAAMMTGLIALLFVPRELGQIAYHSIFILEVLFVGLFFLNGRKAKMFYVDAFFWITLGGFTLVFLNESLTGYALYFEVCKAIINGLVNVLIADMLLAYFPFYKLLKGNRVNKNHVSIHQFLSHITFFSILVPFFISVTTNTFNTYESISDDLLKEAKDSSEQIKRDLQSVHAGNLEDLIWQHESQEYDLVIEENNEMIASTSSMNLISTKNMNQDYAVKELSNQLYEVLPLSNDRTLPLYRWAEGKYVFIDNFESRTILLEYPISFFQNQIFRISMEQLKYICMIVLCMVLLLIAISRSLTNNVKKLTVLTTGLPQKLRNMESIEWPQSSIYELQVLGKNLRKMADKLVELFQESMEMNKKLSDQTNKLKESEEQLHRLAFYDGLTSLPNRHHFQYYVNDLIGSNFDKKIAIIFIDLNQFKQINDTLGHDAGDTLLQVTACKLKGLRNEEREVFRLGGDEFVVVHHTLVQEEVEETIELILNEFSTYFHIHEQTLYITASIGVSMYPDDGKDLNTLVKFADIAMYISKEKGGNIVQFFDESMRDKFHERLVIENALRAVVDSGGFEQYYQPKTFLGKITSIEALLRWKDPELGNVSPGLFIPIAEEMGLIYQIDEWSLLQACRQVKQWQEEGILFVPISVNLSAKHFQQDYLVPMVEKVLSETGLDSKYLKLEITESVFIHNPKHVAEVIHQLKDMGVQISIDDFGKGYSSLYQLLHLPIDEIKIDRQFIKDIDHNNRQALLVKSILEIAHGLELNVVAEGVETKNENDMLVQMGCDEVQGYLFSPPVSKKDLVELLTSKTPNLS